MPAAHPQGNGGEAVVSRAPILGGDVARTDGPLVRDVDVLGEAARPVRRGGARPGAAVWVTGTLGGAAAAVHAWESGEVPPGAARAAFAHPVPRLAEARWLAERGVLQAMIDVSDGLAGDAGHLAAASGMRIVLHESAIPVHDSVREVVAGPADRLRLALAGGEDYELCFAAAAGAIEPLAAEFAARFGVALTRVGEVMAGEGVWLRAEGGGERPLAYPGFDHFGSAGP
jgi:thiamine-monophosphate kinase